MLNPSPSSSATSTGIPSTHPSSNGYYSKEAAIAAQQAQQHILANENADKVARLEKERLIRIEAEKKRRQLEAAKAQAIAAEEERIANELLKQKQKKAEYVAYVKNQLALQKKEAIRAKREESLQRKQQQVPDSGSENGNTSNNGTKDIKDVPVEIFHQRASPSQLRKRTDNNSNHPYQPSQIQYTPSPTVVRGHEIEKPIQYVPASSSTPSPFQQHRATPSSSSSSNNNYDKNNDPSTSTAPGPRIIRVGHSIPNNNPILTTQSSASSPSIPTNTQRSTHTASSSLFEIDSLAVSGSTHASSSRSTTTINNNSQSLLTSQPYDYPYRDQSNQDHDEQLTRRPQLRTTNTAHPMNSGTDGHDKANDGDDHGYDTSSTENEYLDDNGDTHSSTVPEQRPLLLPSTSSSSLSSNPRTNKWNNPIPPPSSSSSTVQTSRRRNEPVAPSSSSSNIIYVSPPRSTTRSAVSHQSSPAVPVPSIHHPSASSSVAPTTTVSTDEQWEPTLDHIPSSLFDSLDLSMSLPQRKNLVHRQSVQKQASQHRRTAKDKLVQARQMDKNVEQQYEDNQRQEQQSNHDEDTVNNAPNTSVLIRQHENINAMLQNMVAIPSATNNNVNTDTARPTDSRIPSVGQRSRSVPRQLSNLSTDMVSTGKNNLAIPSFRATINPSPIQVLDPSTNNLNPPSPTRKISGNVPLRPSAVRNKDLPPNPYTSGPTMYTRDNSNHDIDPETTSVATAPARAISTNAGNTHIISPGIAINHPRHDNGIIGSNGSTVSSGSSIPGPGTRLPGNGPNPQLPPKPSPASVLSPTATTETTSHTNVPIGGRPPPRFIPSNVSEAAFSVQSAQPRLLNSNHSNYGDTRSNRGRSRSPAVTNNSNTMNHPANVSSNVAYDTVSVAETDPGQGNTVHNPRSNGRNRSHSRPRERSQSTSKTDDTKKNNQAHSHSQQRSSSAARRSTSPTPTTVTDPQGIIVHPAAWGKGLITPQDEIRRATLERRKEYQERLKQLRYQALERKQQNQQPEIQHDDGTIHNDYIGTPKNTHNDHGSTKSSVPHDNRSPSPLKKSSPLVQIPVAMTNNSNGNLPNRYMNVQMNHHNNNMVNMNTNYGIPPSTTTVPSFTFHPHRPSVPSVVPSPPVPPTNPATLNVHRVSSQSHTHNTNSTFSSHNVRDSLSLTEEENRLRASLARLDVHIQSKLQAIGMHPHNHHNLHQNTENHPEGNNGNPPTQSSRTHSAARSSSSSSTMSSVVPPAKVPVRRGPALPDSIARIRTAVAVGGGILPPQLPSNSNSNSNSNNGNGGLDAPNSVSSLADVIARTKSIVAQARTPVPPPPTNNPTTTPNESVKNNGITSTANDAQRQVHFSPLLQQPNNATSTNPATVVPAKHNYPYPPQPTHGISTNNPDDTLDVSDFQNHYYTNETVEESSSSPFRPNHHLRAKSSHSSTANNPLYTTMEIERAIDLMSDSFSYPSSKSAAKYERQRTLQTANRYNDRTKNSNDEDNYDDNEEEDEEHTGYRYPNYGPSSHERTVPYPNPPTSTPRTNMVPNGTIVTNPSPPVRISNSSSTGNSVMVRTSGIPVNNNGTTRNTNNGNNSNTGGKVSVADLERITALLGTQ